MTIAEFDHLISAVRDLLATRTITVYLAGYMSADPRTREWRIQAAEALSHVVSDRDGHPIRVVALDPFRGKQELSKCGLDSSMPIELVAIRDEMDLNRADFVILCTDGMPGLDPKFEGEFRQSIGTWSEFGVTGIAQKKPVIIVTQDPNMLAKRHPFIYKWPAHVVQSIAEAVSAVRWLA